MYGRADRTDAELLRLAREGDPLAYEAIVARYREPLRRSCARISPDRAEDAVQHALLSAWLALERGAQVRELRPWLYSIARNAAIDQARGTRTELVELGPEVAGGEDPAQAEARRREVTEVLEAVAALPERQRRALVDTAVHGRTTEAVAVDLGLSGGALRQLVHRARTNVRSAVPSVGFPLPGWIAEFLGEEGLRRGAVLASSGSGAALLAKTTATVATVGALVASGVQLDPAATPSAERASAGRTIASAPNASARPASGTDELIPAATMIPAAVPATAGTESTARAPGPDEHADGPRASVVDVSAAPPERASEDRGAGTQGDDARQAHDGAPARSGRRDLRHELQVSERTPRQRDATDRRHERGRRDRRPELSTPPSSADTPAQEPVAEAPVSDHPVVNAPAAADAAPTVAAAQPTSAPSALPDTDRDNSAGAASP